MWPGLEIINMSAIHFIIMLEHQKQFDIPEAKAGLDKDSKEAQILRLDRSWSLLKDNYTKLKSGWCKS